MRKRALFDSWRGEYADNPRAISERLGETHPEIERVWVLRDPSRAPVGVRAVRPFGLRHLWSMLTASYVFANNAMPFWWPKPPWCTYVQTWHGPGAFKKVGWDIVNDDPRYAEYQTKFAKDVAKWDLLITASPRATAVYPHAFRYGGAVLESGSPRSDLLVRALVTDRRSDVRRELGLSAGQRAVLFAPTKPDRGRSPDEAVELLLACVSALQPDDVLLVRAHPNDVQLRSRVPDSPQIRNVSQADGLDVLLAADVLVTDYSSIFYDFVVTGRPVVFFLQDLDRYRDQLRGLYLDAETELPGPVARSASELQRVLADLGAEADYRAWSTEQLPHEDGRASDRVIEAVLGSVASVGRLAEQSS